MAATFGQQAAEQARYYYERQLFTAGPVNLPPGISPIFTASSWTDPDFPEWQARLVRLQAAQNAGVALYWTADTVTGWASAAQGYTDAMAAGLQDIRLFAPAVKVLNLYANNQTGSTVTAFQLNYEVEMKRLSIAEKLHFGYGLSSQDTANLALADEPKTTGLQQIKGQVERGSLPWAVEEELKRFVAPQRLGDHPASGPYHITANASTTASVSFATLHPLQSGQFMVLEEIAVEGGQPIFLYVDRDQDSGQSAYLQLSGAAFAQTNPDTPWRPWVPALQTLSFRAAAATTLNNVPVRIRVGLYRMTNIAKVLFGQAKTPNSVPGDTYVKTMAGLY